VGNAWSNGRAHESGHTRVVSDFVMPSGPPRHAARGRSHRPNPVTGSDEVVGSSIGRLAHHHMMSCDVCDGLELVRRPYNGRGITKRVVRRPFRGRCPDGLFVTETVTVTQVSLLYRSLSFVLVASMAEMAMDIENRAGCANKRP
jgi:hypothetical protein